MTPLCPACLALERNPMFPLITSNLVPLVTSKPREDDPIHHDCRVCHASWTLDMTHGWVLQGVSDTAKRAAIRA